MKTQKSVMPKVPLGPVLRRYFCEYLVSQRDLSPQTIGSYRDTFRLLLAFLERRYRIKPDVVCVDDLDAPRVLAFLDDLERRRGNTARTRNARRAAIRSFLRYAAAANPAAVAGGATSVGNSRQAVRASFRRLPDARTDSSDPRLARRCHLLRATRSGSPDASVQHRCPSVGTCRSPDSGCIAGIADVRSHSRQRSQESFGTALATDRQAAAILAPATGRSARFALAAERPMAIP